MWFWSWGKNWNDKLFSLWHSQSLLKLWKKDQPFQPDNFIIFMEIHDYIIPNLWYSLFSNGKVVVWSFFKHFIMYAVFLLSSFSFYFLFLLFIIKRLPPLLCFYIWWLIWKLFEMMFCGDSRTIEETFWSLSNISVSLARKTRIFFFA